jgi:hypothetical protein
MYRSAAAGSGAAGVGAGTDVLGNGLAIVERQMV